MEYTTAPRAGKFYCDLSFWVLLAANGATMWYALVEHWTLSTIMVVYWVQSVIIGGFNVVRILSLKKFSTEGFYMNDKPVPQNKRAKTQTATFFAFHYGFFHFIYLVFLLVDSGSVNLTYVLMGGAIFFFDHLFSFKHNIKRDEQKIQNIGHLMFFPYARIIPMHIAIMMGGALYGSTSHLIIFFGLKTLADGIMHVVEHESGFGSKLALR
ncbi:MAG: DUF6498-containing protein [Candidatus Methanofastidiosia archaeon]